MIIMSMKTSYFIIIHMIVDSNITRIHTRPRPSASIIAMIAHMRLSSGIIINIIMNDSEYNTQVEAINSSKLSKLAKTEMLACLDKLYHIVPWVYETICEFVQNNFVDTVSIHKTMEDIINMKKWEPTKDLLVYIPTAKIYVLVKDTPEVYPNEPYAKLLQTLLYKQREEQNNISCSYNYQIVPMDVPQKIHIIYTGNINYTVLYDICQLVYKWHILYSRRTYKITIQNIWLCLDEINNEIHIMSI